MKRKGGSAAAFGLCVRSFLAPGLPPSVMFDLRNKGEFKHELCDSTTSNSIYFIFLSLVSVGVVLKP